jgi:hypothetical protein
MSMALGPGVPPHAERLYLIALIPFSVGYALYVKAQWLRFEPKHDRASRRRKLFTRF